MTPAEAQSKIDQTVIQQAKDDALGMLAAGSTLPGPVRGAFAPVPPIPVGPYKVRRFVSRDFVRLAALGHPLNGLKAMEDEANFTPEGMNCWLFCWLMTRDAKFAQEAMSTAGIDSIKQQAEEEFGELTVIELTAIMVAIGKNLSLVEASKLEYKVNQPEGDSSSGPPPSSQP